MNAVPLTARVRCKQCGQKVPLSREQVRELSGRLRVEVACGGCGLRFAPSMLRRVKTSDPVVANEEPAAVPIPVPAGAKQAAPPFRPLPQTHGDVAPPPTPPTEWLPGADPLPFSPLQTAPVMTDKPSAGGSGWWGRQSKATQYLILGVGVAMMAGAAFAVQTLGKGKAPPPPATAPTETRSTPPSTAPRSQSHPVVPPDDKPIEPTDFNLTITPSPPEPPRVDDLTTPIVTIPRR